MLEESDQIFYNDQTQIMVNWGPLPLLEGVWGNGRRPCACSMMLLKNSILWINMGRIISEILGFNVEVSFNSMYLGVTPEGLSKSDGYLLNIFLVACKKAITKCWLRRNPPTVDLFVEIVTYVQSMEMLTYSVRLQKERGGKKTV